MGVSPTGASHPRVVTAQIANHVLIEWRDMRAKCTGPKQVDFSATVSVAVFEAVNAIEGGYTRMTSALLAPSGSSAEAAAAQVAHDVLLVTCHQMQAAFADALAQSLARVTDPPRSPMACASDSGPRRWCSPHGPGPAATSRTRWSCRRRAHCSTPRPPDVTQRAPRRPRRSWDDWRHGGHLHRSQAPGACAGGFDTTFRQAGQNQAVALVRVTSCRRHPRACGRA